jgi:hypothetical protein
MTTFCTSFWHAVRFMVDRAFSVRPSNPLRRGALHQVNKTLQETEAGNGFVFSTCVLPHPALRTSGPCFFGEPSDSSCSAWISSAQIIAQSASAVVSYSGDRSRDTRRSSKQGHHFMARRGNISRNVTCSSLPFVVPRSFGLFPTQIRRATNSKFITLH